MVVFSKVNPFNFTWLKFSTSQFTAMPLHAYEPQNCTHMKRMDTAIIPQASCHVTFVRGLLLPETKLINDGKTFCANGNISKSENKIIFLHLQL